MLAALAMAVAALPAEAVTVQFEATLVAEEIVPGYGLRAAPPEAMAGPYSFIGEGGTVPGRLTLDAGMIEGGYIEGFRRLPGEPCTIGGQECFFSFDAVVSAFDAPTGLLRFSASGTADIFRLDIAGGTGRLYYEGTTLDDDPQSAYRAKFALSNVRMEGVSPVPLPGTALLYLIGLAGAIVLAARRSA